MAETKPTLYKYQLENDKNTYATLTNGKFTVRNSPNVNEYTLSNLGKHNSMNAAQAAAQAAQAAQAAPVEQVANAANSVAANQAANQAASKAAAAQAAQPPVNLKPNVMLNPNAAGCTGTDVTVTAEGVKYNVCVRKGISPQGGGRRTRHKKQRASRKQKRSTRSKRKQSNQSKRKQSKRKQSKRKQSNRK